MKRFGGLGNTRRARKVVVHQRDSIVVSSYRLFSAALHTSDDLGAATEDQTEDLRPVTPKRYQLCYRRMSDCSVGKAIGHANGVECSLVPV